MFWTVLLGLVVIGLYLLQPYLGFQDLRKVLRISLFLQIFYLTGNFLGYWPFPSPLTIVQILVVVGLGVSLGANFSKLWPISPKPGFERVIRTFLIVIPALGLGVGLQVLLQGAQARVALYLIFALAAWLGSDRFVKEIPANTNASSQDLA